MTDLEIARAIRAEITKAEAALAAIDALATDDFRSRQSPDLTAKAEAAHKRASKALTALHRTLDRASKGNDVIAPQFGK